MDFLQYIDFIPEKYRAELVFLLIVIAVIRYGLLIFFQRKRDKAEIEIKEDAQELEENSKHLEGIIKANDELRKMHEFQSNKIKELIEENKFYKEKVLSDKKKYERDLSALEERLNEILSNTKENEEKLLKHEKTIQNLTAENAALVKINQNLREELKEC